MNERKIVTRVREGLKRRKLLQTASSRDLELSMAQHVDEELFPQYSSQILEKGMGEVPDAGLHEPSLDINPKSQKKSQRHRVRDIWLNTKQKILFREGRLRRMESATLDHSEKQFDNNFSAEILEAGMGEISEAPLQELPV